jgi:hypothetical protein
MGEQSFLKEPDRIGLIAALGICAFSAAWLALTNIHSFQNSDSIVPVLVSLQHWTPFYWGQNRFGMLLPLVALPVRSPLANLLLQSWLSIFAGLLVPFLLASYMIRHRSWLIVAAITDTCLLLFFPPYIRFDWLICQPYALAMVLGLGALIMVDSEHKQNVLCKTMAVLLMVLAHWVNVSVSLLLFPLVAFRRLFGISTRTVSSLALLIFGAGAGVLMMSIGPYRRESQLGMLPVAEWVTSWRGVWEMQWTMVLARNYGWVVLPALAGIGYLLAAVAKSVRQTGQPLTRASVALLSAGAVAWLYVGTSVWVRMNAYWPRYEYPSMLAFTVALICAAAVPLVGLAWNKGPLAILLAAILVLSPTIFSYGAPSLASVRHQLDACCGQLTADVISSRTNIIVGDYWKVYPAVFHANMTLYDVGRRDQVLGVSSRSKLLHRLWEKIPPRERRFASVNGDPDVGRYAEAFALPLVRTASWGKLDLFVGEIPHGDIPAQMKAR